jgi:myo-inositol-1(or 4)-monophosphatase
VNDFPKISGPEIRAAIEAARHAAELVLRLQPGLNQMTKADGSIVTNADLASADLIRKRLAEAFPHDAVLTEEDAGGTDRLNYARCWIVDPIDGTKAYASGSDDFDVYIALAEHGTTVIAVTIQPVTGRMIAAAKAAGVWSFDAGSWRRVDSLTGCQPPQIVTRHWLGAPANWATVQRLAEQVGGQAIRAQTGISARSLIQPGFDAVIGISTTEKPIGAKEWDVAPLDLIMREVGGWSSDLRGQPLGFNKPVPNFPQGLLLAQSADLGRRIVAALAHS